MLALRSDVCCGDGTRCHSDGGGASLTLHEGGSLEGRVEAQVWLMTPGGSHCVSRRATGKKKLHPIKVLCSPEKGEKYERNWSCRILRFPRIEEKGVRVVTYPRAEPQREGCTLRGGVAS